MARKDQILQSFLNHEFVSTKYGQNRSDLPKTVREAMNSSSPIVKAIALIVEGLDGTSPLTETALRNQINQFLNEEAL